MRLFNRKPKKRLLGLAATRQSVTLVILQRSGLARPLVECATVLPVTLHDAVALKTHLAALPLKHTVCNALLNVDQYQILQMDKPDVPEAEVKQATRWKVKDMLDFSVEHATIDVVSIPVENTAMNRKQHQFAVCARNEVLATLSESLSAVGLRIASIDVHAMAQRNIAALLETEGRVLVMVSMLERGGLVTFTAAGELYHTRLIELDEGYAADVSAPLFATNVERLTLALQRSLDGFDRQFGQMTVNRLLIAPAPCSEALAAMLRDSLYVPVETFTLQEIVDFKPGDDYADLAQQALLMPALGAALREEGLL